MILKTARSALEASLKTPLKTPWRLLIHTTIILLVLRRGNLIDICNYENFFIWVMETILLSKKTREEGSEEQKLEQDDLFWYKVREVFKKKRVTPASDFTQNEKEKQLQGEERENPNILLSWREPLRLPWRVSPLVVRGLGENLKCNLVQFSTSNILNTSNRWKLI